MNLTLNLSSTELDNEDLQTLTRQLCDSIADETKIRAEIPSQESKPNARGDLPVWAEIVLTFFGSGGAVALFGILQAYFDRHSSFTIKATKADGTSMEITAQNIKLEQIQVLLSQLDSQSH